MSLIRSSSSGALLFVQRRLLLQLLAQGGQFRAADSLSAWYFPRRTVFGGPPAGAERSVHAEQINLSGQMCAIRNNPQQAFQQREEVRQFG